MNDEPTLHHFDPMPEPPPPRPLQASPELKRLLRTIPPSDKEMIADADHGIAAAVQEGALKRSEARRDAILAVTLAIKRRGGNPMFDWSTKDVDTAYAIADQLIALENT